MSTSGIYAVPKLTDKNWVEFKTKTIMSLMAHSLNSHIDGTIKIPKPLPMSADGKKTFINNNRTEATDIDIELSLVILDTHAQKEALAIQQLYATVLNSVMIQVQNKGSVSAIWKAICLLYKGKSDMVQVDTCACMQNMKCSENGDVKAHLLCTRIVLLAKSYKDDQSSKCIKTRI
ncbi:hypothetical protein DFH29DRAFT_816173 [Suillus ampliporus]|nr:hypothetical protein DFH29DRAFT_816173 [Suillus ampliporus]